MHAAHFGVGDSEGVLAWSDVIILRHDRGGEHFVRNIEMLAFQEAVELFSQESNNVRRLMIIVCLLAL